MESGYPFTDFRDMHLVVRELKDAVRTYREIGHNRRLPNRHASLSVHRRLQQLGGFHGMRCDVGRPLSVHHEQMEEQTLGAVERQPTNSIRRLTGHTGYFHASLHRPLQKQQLHPCPRVSTTRCTCMLFIPSMDLAIAGRKPYVCSEGRTVLNRNWDHQHSQ
jgi:hypothetical protein